MRSSSGASPRVSLSGLPGVTSHQTRSSPSRFIAIRQARAMRRMRRIEGAAEQADAHAGAWGGSETREEGITRPACRIVAVRERVLTQGAGRLRDVRVSRPARRHRCAHGLICPVPRTRYLKLVSCSTPTGPRAWKPAGGDADLGAEAELAAVGELRRGVVQHDRGIDLAQEFLRRRLVLGDDRSRCDASRSARCARSRRRRRRPPWRR